MRGPNCIGVERVFNSPVLFFFFLFYSRFPMDLVA